MITDNRFWEQVFKVAFSNKRGGCISPCCSSS